MKRFYEFFKTSQRLYIFVLSLFVISFILYGCFRLRSLNHPTTAETNSYFDVTFVCEHTNPTKTEGRGYFGALLPEGWRAQDYTEYTVHFPNPDENIYGRLAFDQYYTDALNAAFPAPAGYYWWGGVRLIYLSFYIATIIKAMILLLRSAYLPIIKPGILILDMW